MDMNIKKYQKFKLSRPTFWRTTPNGCFKEVDPIFFVEEVTKNEITLSTDYTGHTKSIPVAQFLKLTPRNGSHFFDDGTLTLKDSVVIYERSVRLGF